MLTSKDLAELLAETPPCEVSEIAKKTTGRGFQQIRTENKAAKFAKELTDDDLTTSQTSQGLQSSESVAKPIPEPFLASSQSSQGGIQKPLTATHCRECNYPAHDTFMHLCPSCGTTHPFAASDEVSEALTLAAWAIAQAALSDEKKAERLADLRRKPEIAGFWAKLFDPTIPPTDSSSKDTTK